MKGVGLAMLVGGWAVAVGGLVAMDDTTMRLVAALLGFGTTIAGLMALNRAHLHDAPWKARGS